MSELEESENVHGLRCVAFCLVLRTTIAGYHAMEAPSLSGLFHLPLHLADTTLNLRNHFLGLPLHRRHVLLALSPH